jgi:hypothetical protein
MYAVDRHDRVEELTILPQQSVGAPLPVVLADDGGMVLAYQLEFEDDKVAIVEFEHVAAHYFGPPNDERSAATRFMRGDWVDTEPTKSTIHLGFALWNALIASTQVTGRRCIAVFAILSLRFTIRYSNALRRAFGTSTPFPISIRQAWLAR